MGIRTGRPKGRPKGSPNKATAAKVAQIEASGLTPLDYMLTLMRNDQLPSDVRFEAAKAAAPYVHPRLASTEIKADVVMNDVSDMPEQSEAEWMSQQVGHA